MKRLALAAVGAATALTFGTTAAHAAIEIFPSAPSGSFRDLGVTCAGTAPCDFSESGTFTTPDGFDTVTGTISTSFNAGDASTNINFSSVLLNGAAFTLSPNGDFEFGSLPLNLLVPGGTNTLTVNGTTTGNGSFAGTLTFGNSSALPEPGTWAMMLLGFGMIGAGMRRQKDKAARLNIRYA